VVGHMQKDVSFDHLSHQAVDGAANAGDQL
jgi:hypothetical protein